MEQYKKWLEEFYKNHRGDMRYQPGPRQGWEAALEWFRDKLDYSIEHKELKDIIDKELEGGN